MTFPSYLPVTAEFFNVSVSSLSLSLSLLFHPIRYIYYNIKTRKADIHAQKVRPPYQRFCLALCCFLLVRLGKEALGGFEFGCY